MTDSRHDDALKAERAYYARLAEMENEDELSIVVRTIERRVAKSLGVLTHTSIMIAVLGAIIALTDRSATPGFISAALLLELLAYIGLTAYLVLTMGMSSPGMLRGDAFSDRLLLIARRRRRIHNFVVKAVAVLTFLLALTLIVEFLHYLLRS